MRYNYTNKKKKVRNNKTRKVGGATSIVILSILTACMSVLQFIYYITAIQKNIQPVTSSNLTISYDEIKKNVESYPEGSPALVSEKSIKLLKDNNPKGMNAAIEDKFLKKIKRKVHDTMVEGYTLSAKGKKLIIDNMNRISQ
jgi:hypothetical protein